MTQTTNTLELDIQYSDGSELIPAEVAARQKREGSEPPNKPVPQVHQADAPKTPKTTTGYTVDQEGLVSNYPVTPKITGAKYPTPDEKFAYLILGGLATTFVGALILIAFSVS